MRIAFFAYFLRFLLISYITNIWLIVIVEMTHGIRYALFWSGANEVAYSIGSNENSTTKFGIMFASLDTGKLLANLIGGHIYTLYGGRMLYGGSSFIFLAWTILISGKILF